MTGTVNSLVRERIINVLDFSSAVDGYFAAEQGQLLQLGEIELEGVVLTEDKEDTYPLPTSSASVTIYTPVLQSCCNTMGTAHGGFLAWLIDVCSSMPIVALSGPVEWSGAGVSISLYVNYLSAAEMGRDLKVISKVLHRGRTATLEARVEDAESGKVIAVATHVKADVFRGKL